LLHRRTASRRRIRLLVETVGERDVVFGYRFVVRRYRRIASWLPIASGGMRPKTRLNGDTPRNDEYCLLSEVRSTSLSTTSS
jgi:hypothetical protein